MLTRCCCLSAWCLCACAACSHPNIVQVYTYVLQPLMQGTIPHSSKQQQRHLQQQEREHEHQQLLQQQQHLQQQVQHQQQQELALQQQPQQGLQGAAAQLLARLKSLPIAQAQQQQQQPQSQPQQPGGKLPPDLSYPNGAAAAAVTGSNGSPRQQQQQASTAAAAPDRQRSGSLGSSRSRAGVARDDSSESLPSARHNSKDLSRLTPEMAKAAAAALPAAAAAAAGGEGGEGFWPRQLSGGEGLAAEGPEAGNSGGEGSMHDGPSLVGWELRLVMEFCDAVSRGAGLCRVTHPCLGVGAQHAGRICCITPLGDTMCCCAQLRHSLLL